MQNIEFRSKLKGALEWPEKRAIGTPIPKDKLLTIFEASDGEILQYYGRIGQGKTYNATADIFDDLKNGHVVYANWLIEYNGHDEREELWRSFASIFGIVTKFYNFKKENLHYFKVSDRWAQGYTVDENGLPYPEVAGRKKDGNPYKDFMDWFASRTDCKIYIDEGHVLFDSYQTTRFSMEKRTSILHTRHFNRTLAIISQRPTAIHVSARANVNRFYKCEKLLTWPWVIFRRLEYQDMSQETVDEEVKPLSRKVYFADKKIFRSYNTKYLRGGVPISQDVYVEGWELKWAERLQLFAKNFRARFSFGLKPKRKTPPQIERKGGIQELQLPF